MGEPATTPDIPHAEYLALEDESPTKHEWLDGVIYDISGGTPDRASLAAAVLIWLGNQLPGKLLASQRSPRIEVFRKNEAGKWVLAEEASAGETAPLLSIDCALSVDEVYLDPLGETAQDS